MTFVKTITGSNGKKLVGLCPAMMNKNHQWLIEDSAESYQDLINQYLTTGCPKLLAALEYLSEFNRRHCDNAVSKTDANRLDVYNAYNARERDCMSCATSIEVTAPRGQYELETALIALIDSKVGR